MLILLSLLAASPTFAKSAPAARAATQEAPLQDWKAMLEANVPAVVSIKVVGTRSFDTESAGSSVGTGFVVDAERGILLTNRHMVHAGPVVAEAVFLNNEEVPLQALYRDPVHDFGFYKFDPEDLKFMDLVELPLHPEEAAVGMEIRVVGNDAGEKIVILDGTLARLDRGAPGYGGNTYNDFNTFYLQAGSSTSGGSSGSPVLNSQGHVIGLNAGGSRRAASSYYLPLDRVVRALELLQREEPVTRGTLQTVFTYTPYDELRRLGLGEEDEASLRKTFPKGEGALVVKETVPNGPAWDKLQPGDILLAVEGNALNAFVPLETALDDWVGGKIHLTISRDGVVQQVLITVQDLHSITPNAFLSFGGGILHPLSYQQARNHALPVEGLYVASPGYSLGMAGVPDGAIIVAIDGVEVPTLQAAQTQLARYADGERVPVRFFSIGDPRATQIAVMRVDRTWTQMQICVRDDTTGLWPCTAGPAAPEPAPQAPQTVDLAVAGPKPVRKLASSLVKVNADLPLRVEGAGGSSFYGAGLVVDAERGWVLCDRDTVPVLLGDVSITFASTLRVPAKVVFVHPVQNIAIIKYDPALLGDTPIESAVLRPTELQTGDQVWQVGVTAAGKIVGLPTTVGRVDPLRPESAGVPQFRASNVETVDITDAISTVGGVLCDKKGRVITTWSSFTSASSGDAGSYMTGIPVSEVQRTLDALRSGQAPRGLGAQLTTISVSDATERGLPAGMATDLAALDPERRQVLYVARVVAGTPAALVLESGDLLVAVDGELVTRFAPVEEAVQRAQVQITVVRDGRVKDVAVPTVDLGNYSVDDVLIWNGLVLHAPHWELMAQRGLEPEGVYVGLYYYGSPAQRYNIRATNRIVAVNGEPTPTLDAFLAVVKDLEQGASIKITMKDLEDQIVVRTMKVDKVYWGSARFQYDDGEWVRE
ncbi:MAG: S1-C subfamily serine protease [Cognaticolwellia sp.]|jgi:S1-C subfamily serine protease